MYLKKCWWFERGGSFFSDVCERCRVVMVVYLFFLVMTEMHTVLKKLKCFLEMREEY